MNRFEGDPKLFLTADGATLDYQGGQPIMDGGLENLAQISLFTKRGWWGNSVIENTNEQIGSDFEVTARGTITLQRLTDIENAAKIALENEAFGNVEANVTNPITNQLDIDIRIEPPGQDVQELRITRNYQNWVNQAEA